MPLRIEIVGRHRTLAGVAKAVFDVGEQPEKLEQAVDALRRANPHLTDDSSVKAGMPLFVPEWRTGRPGVSTASGNSDDLTGIARERAEVFASLAGRSLEEAVAAAKTRAEDARSDEMVHALQEARPDLAEHVQALQEGAAREVERLSAVAERASATIAAMVEALKSRGVGP